MAKLSSSVMCKSYNHLIKLAKPLTLHTLHCLCVDKLHCTYFSCVTGAYHCIPSLCGLYRMGSRSNWGIVARSEAEFNEIVDNLNEQEVRL